MDVREIRGRESCSPSLPREGVNEFVEAGILTSDRRRLQLRHSAGLRTRSCARATSFHLYALASGLKTPHHVHHMRVFGSPQRYSIVKDKIIIAPQHCLSITRASLIIVICTVIQETKPLPPGICMLSTSFLTRALFM
jgi:hypothetical protein